MAVRRESRVPVRREALAVALGVLVLAGLDRALGAALARVELRFPSSVAAMLACFAALGVLRVAAPGVAERTAARLEPARRFLGRWMALFFVPPLVLVPLTPVPSLTELGRIGLVIGGGFVANLFVTALVARAAGAPAAVAPAPVTATRTWSVRRTLGVWGGVALASGLLGGVTDRARVPFGVALAVTCFAASDLVRARLLERRRENLASLFHPVLGSALGTALGWRALGLPLGAYLEAHGTGPGNWLMALLGPAVVSLGLSLDAERRLLRAGLLPLFVSTAFAATFSLFGTALAARGLGLRGLYARALVPRAVTTPIALSLARVLGADAGLTAVFVVSSGVLGALLAERLLVRAGLASPFVLGVATGASSHGIGTAALSRHNPAAAALSGIAFALTAIFSVLVVSSPLARALSALAP